MQHYCSSWPLYICAKPYHKVSEQILDQRKKLWWGFYFRLYRSFKIVVCFFNWKTIARIFAVFGYLKLVCYPEQTWHHAEGFVSGWEILEPMQHICLLWPPYVFIIKGTGMANSDVKSLSFNLFSFPIIMLFFIPSTTSSSILHPPCSDRCKAVASIDSAGALALSAPPTPSPASSAPAAPAAPAAAALSQADG